MRRILVVKENEVLPAKEDEQQINTQYLGYLVEARDDLLNCLFYKRNTLFEVS